MNKPAIWSVSSRQLCSYVKCQSSLGDRAVYVGHVNEGVRPAKAPIHWPVNRLLCNAPDGLQDGQEMIVKKPKRVID